MFILSQVRYKTDVKNLTNTVRLLVAYYSGEELVQAARLLLPPCILLTSVIIAYAKQLCHLEGLLTKQDARKLFKIP